MSKCKMMGRCNPKGYVGNTTTTANPRDGLIMQEKGAYA